jgi:hypothetical protein
MNLKELKYCPGTLAEGFSTYSPGCLRNMFNGKKVNHILSYDQPQMNEEVAELFIENRKRISISGVQEKLSFILEKNVLRLTKEGEQGTYILKPIPRDLKKVDQVPANEHLTMQIAKELQKDLGTDDVAVLIDAQHLCVASRGVEDDTSSTVTAFYGGKFKDEKVREEFLRYLGLNTQF